MCLRALPKTTRNVVWLGLLTEPPLGCRTQDVVVRRPRQTQERPFFGTAAMEHATLWELAGLLACPVCQSALAWRGGPVPGLACENDHRFDVARQGYVNLLLADQRESAEPGHTRDMLEARRAALERGLFDQVAEAIAELIAGLGYSNSTLLDACCGEGHLFASILSQLPDARGVAFDISKHAVHLACGQDARVAWCVANVAHRLPVASDAFDVVTNVLGPANLPEFRRVLREDGWLVKVVPLSHHLRSFGPRSTKGPARGRARTGRFCATCRSTSASSKRSRSRTARACARR